MKRVHRFLDMGRIGSGYLFIGLVALGFLFASGSQAHAYIKVSKIEDNSAHIYIKSTYYKSGFTSVHVVDSSGRMVGRARKPNKANKRGIMYRFTQTRLKGNTRYTILLRVRNRFNNTFVKTVEKKSFKTKYLYAIGYQHSGYRGRKFKFYRGQKLSRLSRYGWNDRLSSIRIVRRGARVYLYQHSGYRGKKLVVRRSLNRLSKYGWNDKASSLKVR